MPSRWSALISLSIWSLYSDGTTLITLLWSAQGETSWSLPWSSLLICTEGQVTSYWYYSLSSRCGASAEGFPSCAQRSCYAPSTSPWSLWLQNSLPMSSSISPLSLHKSTFFVRYWSALLLRNCSILTFNAWFFAWWNDSSHFFAVATVPCCWRLASTGLSHSLSPAIASSSSATDPLPFEFCQASKFYHFLFYRLQQNWYHW